MSTLTPLAPLSPRERQVFVYTAMGHSAKRMAYDLSISESTVGKFHDSMVAKTGMKNRAHITAYALTHGIVRFVDNRFVLP